ncbi:MAG: hypothetical protein NG737_04880 [Omnitrophica bacterium]|nr:hypothetical protein [Candidatus Omnitrophota bacterium]
MKYVLNIIAIGAVVLLIFGIIQFTKSPTYYSLRQKLNYSTQGVTQGVKKFIEARKHNISMDYAPKRKRRLTHVEYQEYLTMYMPNTFENFSPQQWNKFWALIYEPIYDEEKEFKRRRYRTKEEVEDELRASYTDFSRLESRHWRDFWNSAGISWKDE